MSRDPLKGLSDFPADRAAVRAIQNYLRTCRIGGMSRELSNKIEAAVRDCARLNGFAVALELEPHNPRYTFVEPQNDCWFMVPTDKVAAFEKWFKNKDTYEEYPDYVQSMRAHPRHFSMRNVKFESGQ